MTPAETLKEALSRKSSIKIKLLGDSITHGAGGTGFNPVGEIICENTRRSVPEAYCWATLFENYMKERFDALVVNNGCSGKTLHFTWNHFDTLVDQDDDLILCMIGTNNRSQKREELPEVTKEERMDYLTRKIRVLHQRLKENGVPFILMSCIPASEENEKGNELWRRILSMADINDLYKKAQAELGFPFISFYDRFSDYCKKTNTPLDSLLADGLHPNDRGYEVMFQLLLEALELPL